MRGTYTITVSNQKVQFTLELERNITVIRGESGTGKTTLIGLLQSYETYGSQSGVTVQCSKPCRVLSGVDWQLRLEHIRSSIVFVDEGNNFLKSADFSRAVQGSDNYFVLVTRESLYQLPYSVHSVLELRKTASRNKRTYNRAYPYYDTIDHVENALKHTAYLVTEDAKAGYQMFAQIAAQFGSNCVSSNGKSNLFDCASSLLGSTMMIVADGAAFGAEMDKLSKLLEQSPNQIALYLPESFEWLLLISGIISGHELSAILTDPAQYIDSEKYISWEQFFTDLLTELTHGTPLQYSKATLPAGYLQHENIQKVIDAMEHGRA